MVQLTRPPPYSRPYLRAILTKKEIGEFSPIPSFNFKPHSLNQIYPDIVEDIKKLNKLYAQLKEYQRNYTLEKSYRIGRYSYVAFGVLGAGAGIHLATGLGFAINLGILSAICLGSIIKINGYEKEKEWPVVQMTSSINSLSELIAEKIATAFYKDNYKLDLFHLLHLLPDINESGMRPLKILIKTIKPDMLLTYNEIEHFSYKGINFNNVPAFKSSVHNPLLNKDCTYINNVNSLINDEIVDFFTRHEFNFPYKFQHFAIYKKLFSIEKNWSDSEYNNMFESINSLKEIEKHDVLSYIKNKIKNPDYILSKLVQNSKSIIESPSLIVTKEKSAEITNIKADSKDLSFKNFIYLCIDFSKNKEHLSHFETIAYTILDRLYIIENNFYEKLNLEDRQLFDQLKQSDLLSLISDWQNLEKLKASETQKEFVLDCLTIINDKLGFIINNLQENTLKNTKVLKTLYAKR